MRIAVERWPLIFNPKINKFNYDSFSKLDRLLLILTLSAVRAVILVTGASGFVASHICKSLLELGARVRGTVRSLENEEKVGFLRGLVENPKHKIELVEADLLKEETWKR